MKNVEFCTSSFDQKHVGMLWFSARRVLNEKS